MIQFGEEVNREVGKAFVNLFTLIVMATLVTSYVVNKDVLPIPVLLIFIAVALICFVIGVSLLSLVDRNKQKRIDANANNERSVEIMSDNIGSTHPKRKKRKRR